MKRLIDVALSLLMIMLCIPVMIAIGILVRWKLGSGVLYCQIRPGKDGKFFRMCKFRTMIDTNDKEGKLLPDSKRLTSFGRHLRSSSLDELPELWNVLKGDMSLVGPRPLLVEYLPLYTHEQGRRHEVRPGITGWAQINGRNTISWEEKFELDVWYVDHKSFWLDMKILWLTVVKVFFREGVSQDGHATMEKFRGSSSL